MNPFETKSKDVENYFMNWEQLYPQPYNKKKTSPFTKVRIILMNGTEYESNWFLHQFARNCPDNDIRRALALVRNQEQQQQKRISCLKPIDENILESTIAYEQLAIELTAILAQNVTDKNAKAALDFALLEDFAHKLGINICFLRVHTKSYIVHRVTMFVYGWTPWHDFCIFPHHHIRVNVVVHL